MDRMSVQPIMSIKVTVPTDTIYNFDCDFNVHGDGDDTRELIFNAQGSTFSIRGPTRDARRLSEQIAGIWWTAWPAQTRTPGATLLEHGTFLNRYLVRKMKHGEKWWFNKIVQDYLALKFRITVCYNAESEKTMFLSIEWNKTRWYCSWNSHQNCAQNSGRVTFCLSKTMSCAVISSQISSKFTGAVVYNLLCMLPLAFLESMFSIVQNFRSK